MYPKAAEGSGEQVLRGASVIEGDQVRQAGWLGPGDIVEMGNRFHLGDPVAVKYARRGGGAVPWAPSLCLGAAVRAQDWTLQTQLLHMQRTRNRGGNVYLLRQREARPVLPAHSDFRKGAVVHGLVSPA